MAVANGGRNGTRGRRFAEGVGGGVPIRVAVGMAPFLFCVSREFTSDAIKNCILYIIYNYLNINST